MGSGCDDSERVVAPEKLPAEVTINGRKLWKVAFNETISGAMRHAEKYVTIEEETMLQFFLIGPDEGEVERAGAVDPVTAF